VPTLAKGLHVVVKPCNLRRGLLFKEIAILAVPRSPCLQNTLLMAVQASSMAPAAPGRRVGATVPKPRRVAVISGPTGSRRCRRYGTLLKRRLRVRSSRSVSIRLVQRYAVRPGQASHGSYSSKAISKVRRRAGRSRSSQRHRSDLDLRSRM
jgi:hypothetical protein